MTVTVTSAMLPVVDILRQRRPTVAITVTILEMTITDMSKISPVVDTLRQRCLIVAMMIMTVLIPIQSTVGMNLLVRNTTCTMGINGLHDTNHTAARIAQQIAQQMGGERQLVIACMTGLHLVSRIASERYPKTIVATSCHMISYDPTSNHHVVAIQCHLLSDIASALHLATEHLDLV